MRTEAEMMELILSTAREDKRIRAVYMNGSRTNPHAVRDMFQDYDIVYVVTETEPYRNDRSWIDRFGERLYMQRPEECDAWRDMETDFSHCYGWLMQFTDGNRLDLHVQTVEESKKRILEDKLCRILLDKDGILPGMGEPSEEDHYVRRPSRGQFRACCNEFWWCLNNVAKGLWREEIPYAQDMVNLYIRPQLVLQLGWRIGAEHDFRVSVGKSGKYMYRYLPREDWESFLSTYAGGNTVDMWEAVMEMCGLFAKIARETSLRLGFPYDESEERGSMTFLEHVRRLPRDAKEI